MIGSFGKRESQDSRLPPFAVFLNFFSNFYLLPVTFHYDKITKACYIEEGSKLKKVNMFNI